MSIHFRLICLKNSISNISFHFSDKYGLTGSLLLSDYFVKFIMDYMQAVVNHKF